MSELTNDRDGSVSRLSPAATPDIERRLSRDGSASTSRHPTRERKYFSIAVDGEGRRRQPEIPLRTWEAATSAALLGCTSPGDHRPPCLHVYPPQRPPGLSVGGPGAKATVLTNLNDDLFTGISSRRDEC